MVDIVAVTYGQNSILKCFINSIKSQNNNNWRLFIIHDGINNQLRKELTDEKYLVENKVMFLEHPKRTENYGHLLRKWALENIDLNEYILLTNGDNYYMPNMVDEVCNRNEDLIYFDLVHSHKNKNNHNKHTYGYMNSQFKLGFVDIGNVVVKSNLAKKVGFNSIRFAADWDYINDLLKLSPSIYKIDKILFVHN
jgi:choline kinase